MNYQQTLDWMFNQLPMYQQQGASAFRKDLTNTHLLAAHLNHPEHKFKSIHIAGTNGKGSTSSMLASVLQEAGYKVGLYTSPHLKDFRERIKINGVEIPEAYVMDFITTNKAFFESNHLSFFEMTVGLAFQYFVDEAVDVAVIEVGMGGRLDSTNIINPLLSVITNIGMDHVQFLGDTLEAIAGEKAGIIKPGVPAVVSEYVSATKPVFEAKAAAVGAPLYFASDLIAQPLPCGLLGSYQQHNIKAVMQATALLKTHFNITDQHLKDGLLHVVENTGLQGRWQILQEHPKVICDTAHNSHGLIPVMAQLKQEEFERLYVVLGVVNDKDLKAVLPLFPKEAHYFFCAPNLSRALDATLLADQAATYGLNGEVCISVRAAYENALAIAGPKDLIYVGGSTFVIAEIL